jgi:hypothetical protein
MRIKGVVVSRETQDLIKSMEGFSKPLERKTKSEEIIPKPKEAKSKFYPSAD